MNRLRNLDCSRCLKSTDLKGRLIYRRRADQMQAYFLLCMLAYWAMEAQRLPVPRAISRFPLQT